MGMSNTTERKGRGISPLIWLGFGITLALLLLSLLLAVLKVRNAAVEKSRLPMLGAIADFTLTNQNNAVVTAADLRGKVWLADIIFTRCAGPCLRMSQQMKELQQKLPAGTLLVSLTTDPEFDTPEVMRAYAEKFDADPNRWQFLTGSKEQIAALATGSLKLTGIEKKPEERQDPADLFIHSTIFVLVDRQLRLRGVFETEGADINPEQVRAEIVEAARRLEREK
jgi:protein SCO1/2